MRSAAPCALAVVALAAIVAVGLREADPWDEVAVEKESRRIDRVQAEQAARSEMQDQTAAALAAGRTTLRAAEEVLGPAFAGDGLRFVLGRRFPHLPASARLAAHLTHWSLTLVCDPLHRAEVSARLWAEFRVLHGEHGAAVEPVPEP